MDFNDIRTFVSVAEAGTFSGAAAELKLPTSTVSRSVTRLEQSIGTLLCKRSPRGLTLTDAGNEYLTACKLALRSLRDGRDRLEKHRESPSGLLRIACSVTLARYVLAPVLHHFVDLHPELRIEIQPYAAGWDEEPREDVDIYFKLKAPKESGRRVRFFPGTARGLFASPKYVEQHGMPESPLSLEQHRCLGSGVWNLTMGNRTVAPEIRFHIVTSDPGVHTQLACTGTGIAILPLWMASQSLAAGLLVPVLQQWKPEPITVCALYTGTAKLTPKVCVFFDFFAQYFGTELDPRLGTIGPMSFLPTPTYHRRPVHNTQRVCRDAHVVLVTSANGNTGSELVAALLAAGHEIKAFVRPGASLRSALRVASIFEGDLFDKAALNTSMQGVRCVLHISPPHHAGEFALGQAVIHAASDAHVKRVILLSAIHPLLSALPGHHMKRSGRGVPD